ncbi:hypothetical protein Ade02nite_81450 [Paractinoplanes deccanensis]|uniref:non-specific serine/threonine protein kinase n=1 Tax=Paractinoplanes deccanensis TaxID=113561 RepID=A0ABQ3YHQ9_9ACTN|nr:serine/threonine-protein kinase [Actinoplanes deccanensis]GID79504.1 hypothetical protein Ade02nite_81450 [Actinoplanes deccanensis]
MDGQLLGGRYRLLAPVGSGGMAVVWRAHDQVLARTVAVKVLAPSHLDDPASRERIRHEARAAAALSHPNIAQVHDYGEMTNGSQVFPFVVMELVPGGTLLRRLSEGPIPPGFAMRVGAEIAAALAAAHAEGLVHRDIKPANVMLAPTGAKVVDFGIAAVTSPGSSEPPTDEVLGTPAYVAPERILGDVVEPPSDVYALGVVLYRLLSGRSPWTGHDPARLFEQHIHRDPDPLPALPGVPEYVTELTDRCLAKDPTVRPSAREAASLLAHGAGLKIITDDPYGRSAAPSAPDEPSLLLRAPRAVPRSRFRAGRWALAAVAALAAAGTAWLLLPDDRDTPGAAAPSSASPQPPQSTAAPAAAPPANAAARTRAAVTSAPATTAPPSSTPAASTPPTTATRTTPPATSTRPTTEPATPTPAAPAQTFSSAAGTVRASCPSATTAHIVSWQAISPYRVLAADGGPSSAPAVTFKRGKSLTTMTVTCTAGVPAAAVSETAEKP